MRKRLSWSRLLLLAPTVFFVFGYILYPLGRLLLVGTSEAGVPALLHRPQLLAACLNSVLLSLLTVLGSAIIGTYFAHAFRYHNIGGKRFFATLFLLPIAVPPMVGAMAFLFLLGENGLVMKGLNLPHFHFKGWPALLTIHFYSFYPLFYLFVGNALRTLDGSTLEAAYVLGTRQTAIFWRIVLPQLRPALLSASLLTFMASMASFSAPFLFGGAERFLTTEIYYAKVNGDTSLSALLALLLAAISVVFLLLFRRYGQLLPAVATTKGTAKSTAYLAGYRRFSWSGTLLAGAFGLLLLLPVGSLLLISLIPDNALMQAGLHFTLSLANYRLLLQDSELLMPFLNSVQAAFLAVALTGLLGLALAHLIRRRPTVLSSLLELTAALPYGIPGTVIGIGLLLSFSLPSVFAFNHALIGTLWILPVAYTVRNLPVLTQAVKVGLHGIDASVEEAAGSLGAGPFRTWRTITLPLLFPALAEGSLLVFINSFGEFVATVLLYSYATKTLPIEVYAQLRLFNNGMAATYGVVLFGIVLGVIALTRRVVRSTGG